MAYKQKGWSPFTKTDDKKKKSKIDKMIELEKNMDYSGWEGSDAQKASNNRSSIQEHQKSLKQLYKMKEKEKKKSSWKPVNEPTPGWKPLRDLTPDEKKVFNNFNPGPKPKIFKKEKTKPRKVKRHFKKGKK
jgi:hypothetical protein